jgi:hypothetical protein
MDVPGSGPADPRRDRDNDAGGETVEFGGLPFRDVPLLRGLRARLGPAIARGFAVRAVAISLALGLLIGFAAGHFTAHSASKRPPSVAGPVASGSWYPAFITTAISFTGNRCAVRLGQRLELGIQLANDSSDPITLRRVSTIFPLGGLRAVSGGEGACGSLVSFLPSSPIPPNGTDWVFVTVSPRVSCPAALPVWFEVKFSVAGRKGSIVLDGFPDLGSAAALYGHCARAAAPSVSSPTAVIVNPALGSSSGG